MNQPYINSDGTDVWFGKHYILDLFGISNFRSKDELEGFLTLAVQASGANILHSYIHHFGNHGYSGVLVLEESHISIHTWPEEQFASMDIYMCGQCDPLASVKFIIFWLNPKKYECVELKRGLIKSNIVLDL